MEIRDFDALSFKERKNEEYAAHILTAAEFSSKQYEDKNQEIEIQWNTKSKLSVIIRYGLKTFTLLDFEHKELNGIYKRRTGERLENGLNISEIYETIVPAYKYLNSKDREAVRMLLPQIMD